MDNASLIVFSKNPRLGNVKTRIAKKVGDAIALDIYQQLLDEAQKLCADLLNIHVTVYYSDFIDPLDGWKAPIDRQLQIQIPDLGERMLSAINSALAHHEKVIIIGSDCPYITPAHINSTVALLEKYDAVVGPSTDGGFYLLGLRQIDQSIFQDIQWSSDLVVNQLKINLDHRKWAMKTLQPLTDIDEYHDWLEFCELEN